MLSLNVGALLNWFLDFPGDPGGFRELREAGRNHFHLSWYLSDAVVSNDKVFRRYIVFSYGFTWICKNLSEHVRVQKPGVDS